MKRIYQTAADERPSAFRLNFTLTRVTEEDYAQSTQRRFARWLSNEQVKEHQLYERLIRYALSTWSQSRLVQPWIRECCGTANA